RVRVGEDGSPLVRSPRSASWHLGVFLFDCLSSPLASAAREPAGDIDVRMRVTTWAEYGLIVSLNLAQRAGQGPVAARELAEQERLPHDYVEQILLRLRRAGLVDWVRGAKRGYHLARAPQAITVKAVMEASEHVTFEVNCE